MNKNKVDADRSKSMLQVVTAENKELKISKDILTS